MQKNKRCFLHYKITLTIVIWISFHFIFILPHKFQILITVLHPFVTSSQIQELKRHSNSFWMTQNFVSQNSNLVIKKKSNRKKKKKTELLWDVHIITSTHCLLKRQCSRGGNPIHTPHYWRGSLWWQTCTQRCGEMNVTQNF